MSTDPEYILQNVFGFPNFRPLQKQVISNVLNKHDTLAILPTGGGKSLCYQIPALIFEGLTVVVSPLISLMKDQVEALQEYGVDAVFLNSSLTIDEYQSNLAQVLAAKARLLYVSPETLLNPRMLATLESVAVDCLTIDEAHCISQWGHDFRPEYRQLIQVRRRLPQAVCLALTATATERVRDDIHESLQFKVKNEFIASFNRPNLFLEVRPKQNAAGQVVEFVQRFPEQSGIIYCATRKNVDALTMHLQDLGFSALPYHAGLEDNQRKRNQEAFIHDEVHIVVATIAFGMGIDKPDVRFVIHHDLPKSIENYYQEIGRSGRDGLPAHCLLLYSYGDSGTIRFFIDQMADPIQQRIANIHLQALLNYAESQDCRRIVLLRHFGEAYTKENCDTCDNCRRQKDDKELSQIDLTIPARMFLSCVIRTREIFGASHIADVLRGSKNKRVLQWDHHLLSTYGIGRDYSHKQWMHISRQLVQKGLLDRDTRHGSLKMTPKANEFLRSEAIFYGDLEGTRGSGAHGLQAATEEYDHELFELLRRRRTELAGAAGLPPYMIFNDQTLIEMAAYLPQSKQSLEQIHGVGQVKLAKYGDNFLAIILRYCTEKGVEDTAADNHTRTAPDTRITLLNKNEQQQTPRKPRFEEVGEMFNQGRSIEQIAGTFGVQPKTVIKHLEKYLQQGFQLDVGESLLNQVKSSPEEQQVALDLFNRLDTPFLKPVFEEMGGRVSYDNLRILRLYHQANKTQSDL